MHHRFRLLLPVLLSACTWQVDDWLTARNRALCDLHVDCFGTYVDQAACEAAVAAHAEPVCTAFDRDAAWSCVQRLRGQARTCPTADITAWDLPAICVDVCAPQVLDTDTDGADTDPADTDTDT
ncbi:MAG: hypothetical protein H6733_06925 [Alphaproteobacteria bacterium]|nr:hypothetical protein [Alphaproteobacteria bacterium]